MTQHEPPEGGNSGNNSGTAAATAGENSIEKE